MALPHTITRHGIPDRFVEHGTQPQLYAECGFDAEGIYQTAKSCLSPRAGVAWV
jgi:1-deoxy-D-xylulose-5-phosphate synthase